MLSKILSTSSALLLLGCSSTPEQPDVPPPPTVVVEYVYQECGSAPAIDPVALREVLDLWKIENGRLCLTPEGYEDLSFNISEILRGVGQMKARIQYYEACLQSPPPAN